jgi:uncharacterized protein YndB with AHSA1/START domain
MIDVKHQISSVSRSLGTRELPAGQARVVTITRTYASPIADVWDACTNPERISRWFLPVSGDLTLGGRYQLEGNAGGVVERCDPPNSYAATWEMGGEVSWIELHLTDEGDGRTRFELQHIAHVDDERWLQFGPGAVGVGWDLGIIGLGGHLGDGAAVKPEDGMAWVASSDGREFIGLSSDAWCQASVDAGTPPEQARAAADRTTAFYTGG